MRLSYPQRQRVETFVLRALARGPLYEGALLLVADGATAALLRDLQRRGLIERARNIGSHTWRLTEAGQEELNAR